MPTRDLTAFRAALDKLEARPLPLAEKGARGREAPLFKAWAALTPDDREPEDLARMVAAFAERLGDSQLGPAIAELAQGDSGVGAALAAELTARDEDAERWGIERLIALLAELRGTSRIALLAELYSGELALGSEDEAVELLQARSRIPVRRRDPVCTSLCELAIAVLGRRAEASNRACDWIAKTITWETARAGKEEPTLALAAIAALEQVPPIPRLRAARQALANLKRRMVVQRLEAICQDTQRELGLPKQQLEDLLAEPAPVPSWLSLDSRGGLVISGEAPEDAEEEVERARRELERFAEQWTTRLEGALVRQERWPLPAWQAIFPDSGCPLRRSYGERLIWMSDDGSDDEALTLRWDGEGFCDVFGERVELGFVFLRVAHPIHMDKDELELWREGLLERGEMQPIPQLYRQVFTSFPDELFEGCLLPSEPPPLGRARAWVGLPMRRGTSELTRRIGAREVTVFLNEGEQRIESIDWDEEPTELEASELCRDLFDLCGSRVFGDEASWMALNKELKRDFGKAWKTITARYREAPKRLPALRWKVLKGVLGGLEGGEHVRQEGRFVIVEGQGIVELGSGHVHDIERRFYIPPRGPQHLATPLPHDPQLDPELDRILGTIAWLAKQAAEESEG